MKSFPSTIACAAVGFAHLLVGCATDYHPADSDHLMTSDNFLVEFVPAGRDRPIGSYYRVTRKTGRRHAHLVPSEFRGDHPLALGYQKENVRLIESTDGRNLLIEEDIPNDCWMHKNYILVSMSGSGSLEHCYLRVPEVPYEGTPDDPSTLISLDGGMLTFRYANGKIERRSLQSIPKMSQPLLAE